MAKELLEALEILEKEKDIDKSAIISAIESSLVTAYKNQYRRKEDSLLAAENVYAKVDENTGEFYVYAEKTVAEEVENPLLEISLEDARAIYPTCEVGQTVRLAAESQEFSRIATQNAKNVLLQSLREKEKDNVYEKFKDKEKQIVTGVVQRFNENNVIINLGKADGILNEKERVKTEHLRVNDKIRVYVLEVKNTKKSLKILVSRTHPEFVKKLFEAEVTEVADGTVEIKAIAREAGSRTKMAVFSHDPDVDAVGACVGLNGMRVNAVVNELKGEKIDIINWSDDPAVLIENALSPAKVISVIADEEEKSATVIVPDYQLSLAIGKDGQNVRLAARLTGYKIDILNETQASDILNELYAGEFDEEGEGEASEEVSEETEEISAEEEAPEIKEEISEEEPTGIEDEVSEEEDPGESQEI